LWNSFEANKEAGGMIYRSNNLNPTELNWVTKVLDELHTEASILAASIKSNSEFTIRNGRNISELADKIQTETGSHFCDTMVNKQCSWLFKQTMKEEFGPQSSGYIPFKFEAQQQVEASIDRMFSLPGDKLFDPARGSFDD